MQRLEEALHQRAERGTPVGADTLIARVNRELTSEGSTLVAAPTAKDVMQTQERTYAGSPGLQRRWPRWAMAFAGAVVLVIVAVGVPLLLIGGEIDPSSGQPSTTPAPTTTVTPTTTASTPETVPPVVEESAGSMMSWERVRDDSLSPGVIWDITTGGPGLVAVGQDRTDGFEIDGVVWLSPDGRSWERIEDPEAFGGPGGQFLVGVTAGPAGIFAGGEDGGEDVAWFSSDGYRWSRVVVDELAVPGQPRLTIRLGPTGLVAFDNDNSPGDTLFTSADGIDWSRVEDPAQIVDILAGVEEVDDSALPRHGEDDDVATNGELVVAVSWDSQISIWISDDQGATWQRVDPNDPAFLDSPTPHSQTVVFFEDTFVVVGTSGDDAGVWIGVPTG